MRTYDSQFSITFLYCILTVNQRIAEHMLTICDPIVGTLYSRPMLYTFFHLNEVNKIQTFLKSQSEKIKESRNKAAKNPVYIQIVINQLYEIT